MINIFLADLTYTQQGLQSEIAPAAVGGLATYVKRKLGKDINYKIFKKPEKFIKSFLKDKPNVVGFSNYAWNSKLTYKIATLIKKKYPETIVIYGGPNYPLKLEKQQKFLEQHTEMDYFIIKEGEVGLCNLLQHFLKNGFEKPKEQIQSVHWIGENKEYFISKPTDRLQDLTEIPSPYINGDMDEFLEDGFMPIIQTNRGCPFACTFCVEGTLYYNKVRNNSLEKLSNELKVIGDNMSPLIAKGQRSDLFIADSNFGMFGRDLEIAEEITKQMDRNNWPQQISVATGKNQKHRIIEVAKKLRGALRLSGSVQSLDQGVLDNIKRKNVSSDDIVQVALEGGKIGALTYSEIILGLPGDTVEKFKNTVRALIGAGFNKLEVYTLMLLDGSELNSEIYRKEFGLTSKFRVIPRCFGYFDFDGEIFSVGEIEEVVVATNTMKFEEYIQCRVYALLIVLFNNDGFFSVVRKFLLSLKINFLDLIELIYEGDFKESKKLKNIVKSFKDETVAELFDNFDDLEKRLDNPEIVKKYIKGKYGNNVLYKHKNLVLTECFEEVGNELQHGLRKLLSKKFGKLNIFQSSFVDEMISWCVVSTKNLFEFNLPSPEIEIHFDYENEMNESKFKSIKSLGKSKKYKFVQTKDQINLIKWNIGTYGESNEGMSRLLTKINLNKLLRKPVEVRL